MAIVPITIQGTLKTKNYQPLSNFTLYIIENGITIHTHQNNDVTTINGRNTFLSMIEGFITNQSNGYPNGVVTSSSISVNQNNGDILISIIGEGDNECQHFAGAFFTEEAFENKTNNVIAMKFGSEECPVTQCEDCEDLSLPFCDGNPIINLGLDNGTYNVTIIDENTKNEYTQSIESNGGAIEWDVTNTEGLFNPFTIYTLTIEDNQGNVITWINNAIEYNCIRLTFNYSTNTNPQT
jgi:hypothetical protein